MKSIPIRYHRDTTGTGCSGGGSYADFPPSTLAYTTQPNLLKKVLHEVEYVGPTNLMTS
jgi:hypothetical protein